MHRRINYLLMAMAATALFTGFGYLLFGFEPLTKGEFAIVSFAVAWAADGD